ncbi:MAG TPA: response regulator, partial [Gemmatimonadaceae bacterium]
MTAAPTTASTVLVIDDEMGILDAIRILLKNEGFTPYTALGGKKGLEQIAALKPELILTDVRMPDVTGLDILASVRAHDPEAVVILMTAQASLQSAIG